MKYLKFYVAQKNVKTERKYIFIQKKKIYIFDLIENKLF
jgi:hypothetical protein